MNTGSTKEEDVTRRIWLFSKIVITQRDHNLVTLSESRAFCPEGMPLARDESKCGMMESFDSLRKKRSARSG